MAILLKKFVQAIVRSTTQRLAIGTNPLVDSGLDARSNSKPASAAFNAKVVAYASSPKIFFASLLHLVFVKIHPFGDGNGRSARLIEKWFLAEKLGEKAWLLQSEKYYYLHHAAYYHNIRLLGLEYDTLNYANALPFLRMLPQSLALHE